MQWATSRAGWTPTSCLGTQKKGTRLHKSLGRAISKVEYRELLQLWLDALEDKWSAHAAFLSATTSSAACASGSASSSQKTAATATCCWAQTGFGRCCCGGKHR